MKPACKRLLGGAIAAALGVATFPVTAYAQDDAPPTETSAAEVTFDGDTVTYTTWQTVVGARPEQPTDTMTRRTDDSRTCMSSVL